MLSFNEPLWDRAGTCCFTGHRPNRLPSGYRRDPSACAPLHSALREAILQAVRDGFTTFVSGMALGVDTWAAEEVLGAESGRSAAAADRRPPLPGTGRPLGRNRPGSNTAPCWNGGRCFSRQRPVYPLLHGSAKPLDDRPFLPPDRGIRRRLRRDGQHRPLCGRTGA